jgi:radical SAM superfamily enzyme YgiQ (UPF0313 family)
MSMARSVYLINPSDTAFGVAVITPRWLYVLAAATPAEYGDPILIDETLEKFDLTRIQPGDVVGIGIHTGNALYGYRVGKTARGRGATVVYGGIHATLFPDEAHDVGQAHAVVRGDGERVWATVLADVERGTIHRVYEGGQVPGDEALGARWDLLPAKRYMWASVQTIRGCPKHCSFCSVWKTDGQRPRIRGWKPVLDEIIELRRRGFRFIALADDNFYPVTLNDLKVAARHTDPARLAALEAMREARFELMAQLAKLPDDTIFFTQITMEAAEDPLFLDAMRAARIKGALVGVEAVTPDGLAHIHKEFNPTGEALVERLRQFRNHGVHVLGSFIFGLPSDRAETFDLTLDIAARADLTFAQFVMLTPFPGTLDFAAWEKGLGDAAEVVDGVPVTRHWLIDGDRRPKVYIPHPVMSADEIRARTQAVWDQFYGLLPIWRRSVVAGTGIKARLAFVLISKLYRQMYANKGISTDSARVHRSAQWARWLAKPCRRLFAGRPMPMYVFPG